MESTADCQHLLYPFGKRRGSDPSVSRVVYTLLMVILTTSNYFTQINASSSTSTVVTCDAYSNESLSERLVESETVLRGKIVKIGGASSLTVRVLNVYRGDNSTERQYITVNISTDSSNETEPREGCMSRASKGEKYILFLRRQSSSLQGEYKFDLLYDGALGTRDISRTVRQLSEQLAVLEIQLAEFMTTTTTMETQSDADHFAPCHATLDTYCLNGGTCFHIVGLNETTCTCPYGWTGDRCERWAYPLGDDGKGIDRTPAIILGCMAAFIAFLCIILAISYIRNRKRSPCHEDAGVSRDVEAPYSNQEDIAADSNQNTKIQLQELIEEEEQTTNYSKVRNDSGTESIGQTGASSEEVVPLNTNCNRTTTFSGTSLYYPKQSTV